MIKKNMTKMITMTGWVGVGGVVGRGQMLEVVEEGEWRTGRAEGSALRAAGMEVGTCRMGEGKREVKERGWAGGGGRERWEGGAWRRVGGRGVKGGEGARAGGKGAGGRAEGGGVRERGWREGKGGEGGRGKQKGGEEGGI